MHNVQLCRIALRCPDFHTYVTKLFSFEYTTFSCSIHWYPGSTLLLAGFSYIHTVTAAVAWSVKTFKTKMTKLACRSNPAYQFDKINVDFRTPSKMFSSTIDRDPEDGLLQNQRFGSSCSCTTRSWNVSMRSIPFIPDENEEYRIIHIQEPQKMLVEEDTLPPSFHIERVTFYSQFWWTKI